MVFAERATFSIPDYVILALTLAISVAIGVFYAFYKGGQKTTKEFLMGGRNMPFIPTILSLLVSFHSGILILGFSSEFYMKGITYAWAMIGVAIALPIAAVTYVPVFYKLKLTSAFEYLELRFQSRLIRHIGAVFWMIGILMYSAIVLYAPSTAMAAVSNLRLEVLILLTSAVCTFYTMVGGLKAVVWTDAFQGVVMFGGLLAVMIQGCIAIGGPKKAFEIAAENNRFDTNFSADPLVYMNFWVVVFGTAIGWMSVYGINQGSVQRYCSLPSLRQAQWSVALTAPAIILMQPLVIVCGMVMYSYYHLCDPLMLKHIKNRDQLLPYFVLEVLGSYRGLPGLFLAVLYSGTLSSVSTGINSLSAVVWEDFIKKYHKKPISEKTATRITKGLVLLFGLISTGMAFAAQHMGGVFQASLTVLTTLASPKAGVFLLGLFFPWATEKGALAGIVVSSGVLGWICLGAQITKPFRESLPRTLQGCSNETFFYNELGLRELLTANDSVLLSVQSATNPPLTGIAQVYKISYKLYGLIGVSLVLIVGVIVSLMTRKSMHVPAEERRLLWSAWDYVLPKLDKSEKPASSTSKKDKVAAEPEVATIALEFQKEVEMSPV